MAYLIDGRHEDENADENQHRSSCNVGDGGEYRPEEHRDEEQDCADDSCQARAAAFAHG